MMKDFYLNIMNRKDVRATPLIRSLWLLFLKKISGLAPLGYLE